MNKIHRIRKAVCLSVFVVILATSIVAGLLVPTVENKTVPMVITIVSGCIAITICPIVAIIYIAINAPNRPPSRPSPLNDPPPPYRLSWGREYSKNHVSDLDAEGGPSEEEPPGGEGGIWTTMSDSRYGSRETWSTEEVPGVHSYTPRREPSTGCTCHRSTCMEPKCNTIRACSERQAQGIYRNLSENNGLPSYQDVLNGI